MEDTIVVYCGIDIIDTIPKNTNNSAGNGRLVSLFRAGSNVLA